MRRTQARATYRVTELRMSTGDCQAITRSMPPRHHPPRPMVRAPQDPPPKVAAVRGAVEPTYQTSTRIDNGTQRNSMQPPGGCPPPALPGPRKTLLTIGRSSLKFRHFKGLTDEYRSADGPRNHGHLQQGWERYRPGRPLEVQDLPHRG